MPSTPQPPKPPEPPKDLLCQWCRGVIAVQGSDGGLVTASDVREYGGKFYHNEPCFSTLEAMAKYVRKEL